MSRVMRFTMIVILFVAVFEAQIAASARKAFATEPVRGVEIEITFVEMQMGDADAAPANQLSGSSTDVAARLRQLQADGKVHAVERVRLTTVENQRTMVQSGRNVFSVSGQVSGRGGPPQRMYQQENIGTLVAVTASVHGGSVLAALEIEKSQIEEAGQSEDAPPAGTAQLTCQTTVQIHDGMTVIVGGVDTRNESRSSTSVILASARILESTSTDTAAARRHLKIFALKYASAENAAIMLSEVVRDAGDTVRIGIDQRTNSLLASGSEDQLEIIEAVLLQLDTAAEEPAK